MSVYDIMGVRAMSIYGTMKEKAMRLCQHGRWAIRVYGIIIIRRRFMVVYSTMRGNA